MRSRRGALAAVLVGILLISGCATAPPPATPKPLTTPRTPPTTLTTGPTASPTRLVEPIDFTNCTDQIRPSLPTTDPNRVSRLSFKCGRLEVPLDYSRPDGPTVQIYVVRVHDTSQVRALGSLVVNPGGPAGSGVGLAIDLSTQVSDELLANFDLVGFDPRGVFLSSALTCTSDATKDLLVGRHPDVRTAAGYRQASADYAAAARACAKKYGTALLSYNTVATARDMDLVRQALGDDQLNYLGYGYGSLLGAVYAHLYPGRLRAAVLDGAVDPTRTLATSTAARAAGLERAFTQFAQSCRAQTACRSLGNPRVTVPALIRALDAKPLKPTSTTDHRRVTGAYVVAALSSALPSHGQWDALRDALIAARGGDPTGLLALVDTRNQRDGSGHYTNWLDARTAITCNDIGGAPTQAQVQSYARTWASKYPVFGLSAAASLLRCSGWPAHRTPLPSLSSPTAPAVLVIGTVHDPVTPYRNAAALARQLGTGVVLSWQGAEPKAYPRTDCLRAAVDAYLIELTVPAKGASCPA